MLNISPQPFLPPVLITVSRKQVILSVILLLMPAPNCAQVLRFILSDSMPFAVALMSLITGITHPP